MNPLLYSLRISLLFASIFVFTIRTNAAEHSEHSTSAKTTTDHESTTPAEHDGHGESAQGESQGSEKSKKKADDGKTSPASGEASSALNALIKGNERFIEHHLEHPNQTSGRLEEIAQTQKPIAVIVSCSDSRVPPEIIFDQGLGDLFIIRSAGQVLSDPALGSIEYALEHLNVKLIMVLGHERCGAVKATKEAGDSAVPAHIASLVKAIKPAVEKTRDLSGDPLTNAIQANIKMQVELLKKSEPIISEYIKKKGVRIVGAYYDLDTGVVSNID
jgi:carbonic anhydrase